ncbi:MAG: response regulator transcription factor [Vulcanimicrobiaceae bacterium]
MRLLLIEDDVEIAAAIETLLARRRYAVDVVGDGLSGLDRILDGGYDAAIVDVNLPGCDGFSICRAARADAVAMPLLILTARDDVEDRIRGLDAGADDYLVKPFAEEELAARLRALLRRADRPPQPVAISIGTLVVDVAARTASVQGRALCLGTTEFRLLELFARHRGMTLSRTQILAKLWDYDFQGSSNIVDVYVSQLRRKFAAARVEAAIQTVWGVGYKLVATGSNGRRSSD